MWCIPAEGNAHFVCQMESVLEVYKRPPDPSNTVVCMDETTLQCIKEVRAPIAARPGVTEHYDVEYELTQFRPQALLKPTGGAACPIGPRRWRTAFMYIYDELYAIRQFLTY